MIASCLTFLRALFDCRLDEIAAKLQVLFSSNLCNFLQDVLLVFDVQIQVLVVEHGFVGVILRISFEHSGNGASTEACLLNGIHQVVGERDSQRFPASDQGKRSSQILHDLVSGRAHLLNVSVKSEILEDQLSRRDKCDCHRSVHHRGKDVSD